VLLAEPPRSPYDLNFVLFGIPVRVHPFFWLVCLLFGLSGSRSDPMSVLLWVIVVFVSILIHEMGHAIAIRAHGWQPSITLHGMGGLASYRPTRRTASSEIAISLAGPAAGFLFAAFIVTLISAAGHAVRFDWRSLPGLPVQFEFFENRRTNLLIYYLLDVNIFWGLVNLLPVMPLDGSHVARELLEAQSPGNGLRRSLMVSLWVGAAMALYAVTRMQSGYVALMFGFLAYNSYSALQSFGRGFGGRW
jgi:Zn-dependent protease